MPLANRVLRHIHGLCEPFIFKRRGRLDDLYGAHTGAEPVRRRERRATSQATRAADACRPGERRKGVKQNKVALVLFWNPKSAEDQAVHLAVQVVADLHHFFEPFANNPETLKLLRSHGIALQEKIAVLESPASEVASFGSFTKTVPVYQTPTILIVNPLGQVSELDRASPTPT